jgi:uncharacterized protein (DUF58 family)
MAILVLVLVALVAIRLVIGAVVGFVMAVLWIAVLVALVAAVLWARSTLKAGKSKREVKDSSSREVTARPGDDPIEVEMRRITEQLREQGRRP